MSTKISVPGVEAWQRHLAELPAVDPPDDLWQRIDARRPAPRRRRAPAWFGGAVAAGVLLAVGLWQGGALDSVVMSEQGRANAARSAVDPGVRHLDDELALAYSRNAGEQEIEALWQARERLLSADAENDAALLARL